MKKIFLILFALLLTSCGTTYQLSTLNHDPIYGPDDTEIRYDIIDSEFALNRKLRTDDKFRWNFAQYAMNQDLRWHYDFYWNNRMYRSPFASAFDFYWNSNQYWWNWSSNYPFNYGFNHWDPFGFNGNYSYFGYYGYSSHNYPYWGRYGTPWYNWRYNQRMNDFAWNNRDRTNTAYVVGRRGSNNARTNGRTVDINTNSNSVRSFKDKVISVRNKFRTIVNNNNTSDEIIDRAILKLKGNNNNVRVYTNPNNVPSNINSRVLHNNNSNNIRIYQRPSNVNSNTPRNSFGRGNSTPVRTYSTPSTPSNSGRSSGGSISRGSGGNTGGSSRGGNSTGKIN